MNDGIIAVRYAKALFLSAKESGKIDEVKKDMLYILELSSLKEVQALLKSPVIDNPVKRSALQALLKGKVSPLSINLVTLSVNNNREMFLPSIARSFIKSADKHAGITKASLTTAVEINDSIIKNIRELLEKNLNNSIEIEEILDPDIIGGFLLKVEDTFIDGSIKTQLRKIEKELKEEL